MGIVSNIVEFVFPRPRSRAMSLQFRQRGFLRPQNRVYRGDQFNRQWLRRANRNNLRPTFRVAPRLVQQLPIRRPFAPKVQPPIRQNLFGSVFSTAGSMFSTTYTGPTINKSQKNNRGFSGPFKWVRRAAMFRRLTQ